MGEVDEWNPHVFEKTNGHYKHSRVRELWCLCEPTACVVGIDKGKHARCMPSSSEDLTFAKITSEEKGRKTVNLKTTMILDD